MGARALKASRRCDVGFLGDCHQSGDTLLDQERIADVLEDRAPPALERLYARLEDEYELKERADVLTRKLTVISETAKALADIIDTERSLRLEAIIVILILVEICFTVYQLVRFGSAH